MALEDILTGFQRTALTDKMDSIIEQNPRSADGRILYGEYLHKYGGITNLSDAQTGARGIDPTAIGFQVKEMKKESIENLVNVARANSDDVITNLPSNELLDYALELSGARITTSYLNNLSKVKDPAVANPEYDKLRVFLSTKYDKKKDGRVEVNKYWASIVATVDPNAILRLAYTSAAEEEEKFLEKHVGTKKKDEKTGEEEYVLDETKLRAYIKTKINGLEDKDKDDCYVDLAKRYVAYKSSKK